MKARLLLALALVLAVAPAGPARAASARPTPPPVSAFARLPFVQGVRLSPDGSHMAFEAATDGRRLVAVVDLEHAGTAPVRGLLPEDTEVIGIHWVNDRYLLVQLAALRFIDGDAYVTRAAAIDTHNGKVTPLMSDLGGQQGASLVWMPADGSSTILMAGQKSIYEGSFYPGVYRVDVASGESREFLGGHDGVLHWMADPAGFVRAGIGYEDRLLTVRLLYRSDEHGPFRTVDRADLHKDQSLVRPFLLMPNDRALAMVPGHDGNVEIHELDMNTLGDVRTVFAPSAATVTGAILDHAGTTLTGAYTSSFDEPVHWFDERLAKLQARFAQELPGYRVSIVDASADRQRLLVEVAAADAPGAICLYDAQRDRLEQVAQVNAAFGMEHLAPVRVVHYAARDGLEIEGLLTLPAGRKTERLPMVVMPHGGPWSHDRPEYNYLAQFIASRGYLVLQPNFRGSTGYGDAFRHRGDGQLGLAMQDDLSDGVRWAVRQGFADPQRVCILGWSYGGYAAMWGVVRDPDQYRCAVSIAGVSSLDRNTWAFAGTIASNLNLDAWKRMAPDFDAVSPIDAIDRIHTPLLLVHGRKDIVVDFSQSQRMYDRLHQAGKTVELVALPQGEHSLLREQERNTLLASIEAFLAKYNPAD